MSHSGSAPRTGWNGRPVVGEVDDGMRYRRGDVHSVTHRAGSDSTPCTRTRTGAVIPAGPAGGENEKNVPDGSMMTSPGAGAAAVSVSATGADQDLALLPG